MTHDVSRIRLTVTLEELYAAVLCRIQEDNHCEPTGFDCSEQGVACACNLAAAKLWEKAADMSEEA